MDIISDGLRTLCAWLCEGIYMLVASLYDLFINISRVELLTSEQIQPIYQRITMILTIVMVFYVTFEAVKFVIQPEQFSDKEKGAQKIVIRMVLVVLLIAFVPQIFSGAYWVQNKIFDTQVFSKVILGKQNVDSDQFGKNLSYNIFSMFYSLDTQAFSESDLESEKCGSIPCKQVVLMNYNQLQTEGKLTFLTEGLNESGKAEDPNTGEKVERYYINFNGLFAVGVGAFIAYMLLLYCVDAGVRVVQLLFLQIIAPIPIMGYLSPKKDGIFEKWTKQCLTTYLDLFLRVGIIYFVLMICQILGNAFKNGTLVNNASSDATWLIYIALIMGLLLFAHKMPKMLQELFPKMGAASGNFGLKATERVAPEAARVAGAALGATRFVGGAVARGVGKHIRNKANNAHAPWTEDGQEEKRQRQKNRQHARNMKRDLATVSGMQSRASDDEVNESKRKVKTAADKVKNAKTAEEKAKAEKELDEAKTQYRDLMRKRSGLDTEKGQEILKKRHNYAEKRNNLSTAQRELDAAKATNDPDKIAAAQNKVNQAEAEFQKATDDYKKTLNSSKAEENVGQNWAGIINSQQEAEESRKKLEQAQQNLATAQASGDKALIKVAQAEVDRLTKKNEQKQDFFQMQKDSYKNIQTSDVASQKAKYDDALSQVAEDNNTRYVNPVGAAAVGAVSGLVTGAREGFKATKLEEIIPKAKEGHKKDIKNIQELNKYYDNGGAQGIQGFIDRTVANIEKNVIGVDTAYARINLENQRIENKIKEYDSSIARADNVKKEFDATEDRIKSKLDDNKVLATIVDENGVATFTTKGKTPVVVKHGENYGDVNRRYRAIAKNANAISEAASKDAEEKEARLNAVSADKRQKFEGYIRGVGAPTSPEELQEYNTYRTLQQEAEVARINATRKSEEAVAADRDAKDVEKMMTRAIFTEMLNDPEFESKAGILYDGVAVQKLKSEFNELKIALQDPVLRAKTLSNLAQTGNTAAQSAFISSKYEDYDQMDVVMTALSNARSALAMEKQAQQDQKNRNQASSRTEAQKAAQDYNGNSGK